jgi:hypothetical protein
MYLCKALDDGSNCESITGTAVVVGAKGGGAGTCSDSPACGSAFNPVGGAGGDAALGVGTIKYSGGTGGGTSSFGCGGGGGGAAGAHGNGGGGAIGSSPYCGAGGGGADNGAPGADNTGGSGTFGGGNGGNGAAGSGGAGASGGSGTEWDSTHGSGGGGGGGAFAPGGGSGLFGGGGGGQFAGYGGGQTGGGGIIVITYVPSSQPIYPMSVATSSPTGTVGGDVVLTVTEKNYTGTFPSNIGPISFQWSLNYYACRVWQRDSSPGYYYNVFHLTADWASTCVITFTDTNGQQVSETIPFS